LSNNVSFDNHNEIATIKFPQQLPNGFAKLQINFEGILNDKLKGFYRSKYLHPSGQEKYAATTQFEVN
jgi:puromycin-sensitive aminopeptidase